LPRDLRELAAGVVEFGLEGRPFLALDAQLRSELLVSGLRALEVRERVLEFGQDVVLALETCLVEDQGRSPGQRGLLHDAHRRGGLWGALGWVGGLAGRRGHAPPRERHGDHEDEERQLIYASHLPSPILAGAVRCVVQAARSGAQAAGAW